MWVETFRTLSENDRSLAAVLLKDRIPLALNGSRLSASLLERASGLLAARLPVRLVPGERRRLIFLLPNPSQSLGRFLAVSLLLADFVHRRGVGIQHQEKGELIRGDLLLVTQHIRECVTLLRGVAIKYGTESLPLSKFWPIEVVSQYSPAPDNSPRVFVANPGWSSSIGEGRSYGSVVLDVSHPRTADHLDKLLAHPSIAAAPVQILVIPPCEQDRLDQLQASDRESCLAWAWDPAALDALETAVGTVSPAPPCAVSERHVWVCDDEPADEFLSELHQLLVGAMRAGNGRVPPAVLEAWSVYHRLRQLAVPLVQLEEERSKAYRTVTLKDRIQSIEEHHPSASGNVGAYLESRWPKIVRVLQSAYDYFLKQREPAKFYTLAGAMEEHLSARGVPGAGPLRIVAPNEHEASMLAALLGQLVGGWSDALQAGAVTIATAREEPRLVAEGCTQATVLLGFRTSDTRYLDVYPGVNVYLVGYPYEAEVDEAIQRRVHVSIERLQENASRTTLLRSLHLPVRPAGLAGPASAGGARTDPSPRTERAHVRHRGDAPAVKTVTRKLVSGQEVEPLDIVKLAGMSWWDDLVAAADHSGSGAGAGGSRAGVELVEVVDTTGARVRYPATRLIDVFYPATETREQLPAGELLPGTLMIVLVDDPYEDLFHRLLEAIREQRDLRASMALQLWKRAKQAALTRHGGVRRRLHQVLSQQGISVEYEAAVGWYAEGEDEVIAPQKQEDFAILAAASGIYTDQVLIAATFKCIENERTTRRQCGKILTRLLTQIAAGNQFDVALSSAKVLGTPVEHVAAAVVLREVESVHRLGGISCLGD
jgi:hypothetical protein